MDFLNLNQELIHFSNYDNIRSIPSIADGLKPSQRKVLYACLKRNLFSELKVAQLAAAVAEISAYHHGEQSLVATRGKLKLLAASIKFVSEIICFFKYFILFNLCFFFCVKTF